MKAIHLSLLALLLPLAAAAQTDAATQDHSGYDSGDNRAVRDPRDGQQERTKAAESFGKSQGKLTREVSDIKSDIESALAEATPVNRDRIEALSQRAADLEIRIGQTEAMGAGDMKDAKRALKAELKQLRKDLKEARKAK